MCFNATIPPEINKVLHLVLYPGHTYISTINKNEMPTVDAIIQLVIPVKFINDIFPTLHSLLVYKWIDNLSFKALIFSSTAR